MSEIQWEEAILARSVHLDEVDTDVFCASKDDLWTPPGARGIFGGQTICQTLLAAIQSVESQYHVHSFHGYFLLAGDSDRNLVFHVFRIRDGKSFATRTVEARQQNKAVFTATIQFHVPEPSFGLELQESIPAVVPPDNLPSDRDILRGMAEDQRVPPKMRDLFRKRLEQPASAHRRPVPPLASETGREPVERFWMQVTGELSDDPIIHLVALAYMSDMGMLGAAYPPFGGLPRNQPSMMVSLDHSMWFHSREFRADSWLLFEIRCIRAAGARVLGLLKVWTQEGHLVLSCTQEGLSRHKRELKLLGPKL